MTLETTLKKIDKFVDWKVWIVLGILLLFAIFKPYIGNYTEKGPNVCGHYSDLYTADDEYIRSCKLTCARDYNCTVAWDNTTYFNHTTNICHCSNRGKIDYTCYRSNYSLELAEQCYIKPAIVVFT